MTPEETAQYEELRKQVAGLEAELEEYRGIAEQISAERALLEKQQKPEALKPAKKQDSYDGGPAFPSDKACDSWQCRKPSGGMSLRDYAIVHFMAALMQREEFDMQSGKLHYQDVSFSPDFIAAEQADAMLAARKDNH